MLVAEPPELTHIVAAAPRGGERRDASLSRPFWLFAAAHLILWTLVPAVAHFNLPADTVEMLFCGHEWQLGYPKHPPLPSWISEAAYVASNHSTWSLYLVAQITVVLSFWGVWRLAREFVSPPLALLSVCTLDCCYFYTYSSTEYNNNVAMYPCWSLGVLFLYWAVQHGRSRYWLAAGAALGAGLLAKYTTATLVFTMVGFLALHPKARRVWQTSGPYLMLATAIVVFSPHLYWAIVHSFPTIEYALQRINGTNDLAGHLLYPLWFAADQLVEVLPIAVVIMILAGGRVRWRRAAGAAVSTRFPAGDGGRAIPGSSCRFVDSQYPSSSELWIAIVAVLWFAPAGLLRSPADGIPMEADVARLRGILHGVHCCHVLP